MKPEPVKVKVVLLKPEAKLPKYGTEFSAGADLYACVREPVCVLPGQTRVVPTGIALELPVGTVGLIYARSGMALKRGLAPANKVGVIDCDYRGEILVALHNHGEGEQFVEPGERVAQLVVAPYLPAVFSEEDSLSESGRGEGGFGSTGRK